MTNKWSRLQPAIVALHQRKTADYGDAWKRRGEVLGILANIARKVDRIEHLAGDSGQSPDESALDTVVDLLVYSVKYLTYLADLDAKVRTVLLLESTLGAESMSDGVEGFELLLALIPAVSDYSEESLSVKQAAAVVVERFAALESLFVGAQASASVRDRAEAGLALANAAVCAVQATISARPHDVQAFVELWGD